MTSFAFGYTEKSVKGHFYRYFWSYNGAGNKSEIYLGKAGSARTEKRGLEAKLQYLQALGQEIQKLISDCQTEIESLPSAEEAPRS